jgi:hypothetical protein
MWIDRRKAPMFSIPGADRSKMSTLAPNLSCGFQPGEETILKGPTLGVTSAAVFFPAIPDFPAQQQDCRSQAYADRFPPETKNIDGVANVDVYRDII